MKVVLAVYDLSHGMAAQLSGQFLGTPIRMIPHSGVVVYGREFFYGGGIHAAPHDAVKRNFGVEPAEMIELGETELPEELFVEWIESQRERFTPAKYDLFTWNCNNFTDEACRFLLGKGIPEWIPDIPKRVLASPMGQMLRPIIEQQQQQMYRETGGQFSDPFSAMHQDAAPAPAPAPAAGTPVSFNPSPVVPPVAAAPPAAAAGGGAAETAATATAWLSSMAAGPIVAGTIASPGAFTAALTKAAKAAGCSAQDLAEAEEATAECAKEGGGCKDGVCMPLPRSFCGTLFRVVEAEETAVSGLVAALLFLRAAAQRPDCVGVVCGSEEGHRVLGIVLERLSAALKPAEGGAEALPTMAHSPAFSLLAAAAAARDPAKMEYDMMGKPKPFDAAAPGAPRGPALPEPLLTRLAALAVQYIEADPASAVAASGAPASPGKAGGQLRQAAAAAAEAAQSLRNAVCLLDAHDGEAGHIADGFFQATSGSIAAAQAASARVVQAASIGDQRLVGSWATALERLVTAVGVAVVRGGGGAAELLADLAAGVEPSAAGAVLALSGAEGGAALGERVARATNRLKAVLPTE